MIDTPTIQDVHDYYKVSGTTEIYYCTQATLTIPQVACGQDREDFIDHIDVNNLSKTHVFLGTVDDDNLEHIFMQLNTNWGYARSLIRGKGLTHTSMSVGDIVVKDKKVWVCAGLGFVALN